MVLLVFVLVKILCVPSEDTLVVLGAYTIGAMGICKSNSPVRVEYSTGKLVHVLWNVFLILMAVSYNVEIHSKLITQELASPIESA